MARVLSKKNITLHRDASYKDHLKSIQNFKPPKQNILHTLLNPTPSKKHSQSTTTTTQQKKYNPKFERKDYQTLWNQNMRLKQQLINQKQVVNGIGFKLREAERKVRVLENMQGRLARVVEGEEEGKKGLVYAQILKRKVGELNQANIAAEQKIKELKQLPHVSVFDQSTVEKEYLMRETIRLKAVITSMPVTSNQDDFQNKFIRLMRQQNQKMKATIRLLQNDKNLLKSRQGIQKRQIIDQRKETQQLKLRLINKDAQIQKLNNQNKNLLFTKMNQLKMQQQRKQNMEIQRLREQVAESKEEIKRLQNEKDMLLVEYDKLKKKEVLIQALQSNQDREKYELRMENQRWKRIIEELREELGREKENVRVLENQQRKKFKEKAKMSTNHQVVEKHRPVKFEQIQFSLLTINAHIQLGTFVGIQQLFAQQEYKCARLIELFADQPLGLDRTQATKLARYIVQSNNFTTVVYDQKATAPKQLCISILKAALNKLLECCSRQNQQIWKLALSKSKKLMPELQKMQQQLISKQALIQVLSRMMNYNFGNFVTYAIITSFDLEGSQVETMLCVEKLVHFLKKMGG